MNTFSDRLNSAELFEKAFIEMFNKQCAQYQIVKYGIESTEMARAHEFIRLCQDKTSHFLRYFPDSVLVNVGDRTVCNTTLIEFKAATTGVRKDSFLSALRLKCPNMQPSFTCKEDIYNIENEALELYQKLQSIGVRVVVVAFAGFRKFDDQIRAQFVAQISKCNTYNPNANGRNTGSGTHIANVNFSSFEPLGPFFERNFGIATSIMNAVADEVGRAFNLYSRPNTA